MRRSRRYIEVTRQDASGQPETVSVEVDGSVTQHDGRWAMVNDEGNMTYLDEAPAARPPRFGRQAPAVEGTYDTTTPTPEAHIPHVDDLEIGSPFGTVHIVDSGNVSIGDGTVQRNSFGPDGHLSETTFADGKTFRSAQHSDPEGHGGARARTPEPDVDFPNHHDAPPHGDANRVGHSDPEELGPLDTGDAGPDFGIELGGPR